MGADLVCFDEGKEKEIGVLGQPYRMGTFDPRLPHGPTFE